MHDLQDNEEALMQLVVNHQAPLHAFVLALLPGHPDVDDIVQEVNAAIWKKRKEFEIGTNFKAWLFSIAKFKVMALWRDQKRRKVWSVPEATLTKLIEDATEVCYETNDVRHQTLRECIQQLRPEDRGLILRRYFEGHSLTEVALEVGRKAENLKGSLHRIRLALRACVRSKLSVRKATS